MKETTKSVTPGNRSCENIEQQIESRTQIYFDIVLQFSCYRNRFSTQFGTIENANWSPTNDLSSHWTNSLENFCHRRQKTFVKDAKEYLFRVYLLNIYGTTQTIQQILWELSHFQKNIFWSTLRSNDYTENINFVLMIYLLETSC